jgi:hypothetical protein
MQSNNNPRRNRPAEEGKRNDPDLRDNSAAQPGVQTMSSSDTDEANQNLTETAADSFREDSEDKNADPDLYGIGQEEDDNTGVD